MAIVLFASQIKQEKKYSFIKSIRLCSKQEKKSYKKRFGIKSCSLIELLKNVNGIKIYENESIN